MSEGSGGARVIQVIVTTLLRRGTGKDESSPVRGITQYWSLDGKPLAEDDPLPGVDSIRGVIELERSAGADAAGFGPDVLWVVKGVGKVLCPPGWFPVVKK